MELVLQIEGQEKTFVAPFVSGRMLRKTLETQKNMDFSDIKVETLDELVDYVVDLFGKQFSRDQFYDGIESNKLFSTINNCIATVIGMTNKSIGGIDDPNVQATQPTPTTT